MVAGASPPVERSTVPALFKANYNQSELMRRVGRLEQVAGVRLVTAGDGIERGVRLLEFRTGTGLCHSVLRNTLSRGQSTRPRRWEK